MLERMDNAHQLEELLERLQEFAGARQIICGDDSAYKNLAHFMIGDVSVGDDWR